MERPDSFCRYQRYGETSLGATARIIHQRRHEDTLSFVLELEEYLDQDRSSDQTIDGAMTSDFSSVNISKVAMKGYTDDPYLSSSNHDSPIYQQLDSNINLSPYQSSGTLFRAPVQSRNSIGSNDWSSSPDNSGSEEYSTSLNTYVTLPSSDDAFPLSYDVNSFTTADKIHVSASHLNGPELDYSPYIGNATVNTNIDQNTNINLHGVQIKIEVEDSGYDQLRFKGKTMVTEKGSLTTELDANLPLVIKSEVDDEVHVRTEILQSIPCPICGMGETGTHNHYGGRACTSCRAFFRRSVQTNSFKNFRCQNSSTGRNRTKSLETFNIKPEPDYIDSSDIMRDNSINKVINTERSISINEYTPPSWGRFECKIDSRSWKSCRFCRFNKCIASGMRPGWVLTKEERIQRQNKRSKAKKNTPKANTIPKAGSVTKAVTNETTIEKRYSIICPVMPEDLKQINQRYKSFTIFAMDLYVRYFASRPQVLMDMIKAQYYQTILPYEVLQQMSNSMKVIMKESFNRLRNEDFAKKLTLNDCYQLVESNVPLIASFSTSVRTSNKPRPGNSCQMYRTSMRKRIESPQDDEEREQGSIIRSVFDALHISINECDSNLTPMQYWQFFSSPWASSIEYEQRHLELTRQMSYWPVLDNKACIMKEEVNNEQSLDSDQTIEVIDELQVFLMSSILLFSTEGLTSKLERPDIVEEMQEYYLTMLHRYLKYRYGQEEAMARLARGVAITSMAREAQEICSMRLPV